MKQFNKEQLIERLNKELQKEKFVVLNYENIDGLKEFMKSYVKAINDTQFSDDQLMALSVKGECILEDMISHMQNGKYPNDLMEYLSNEKRFDENIGVSTSINKVVSDFVEQVEIEYFGGLLYEKASKSFNKRYDEISEMSGGEAIKNAYEIVLKSDILMCFEDCYYLEIQQVKDLLELEDPLGQCYIEWLDNDCSHMEELRDTVSTTANKYCNKEQTAKIEYINSNNNMGFNM